MISLWRDLPPAAWPVILSHWTRTAALAWLSVAVGQIIDGRSSWWWLVAMTSMVVAAATVWLAEIRTARIHVAEERRLRHIALRGWWATNTSAHHPSPEGDRVGGTVTLLTDSVAGAANYRAEFLGPTFAALSAPLIVVSVIGWAVDLGLALVLGILVLVVPVVTIVFGTLLRTSAGQYRRLFARISGSFQEVLRSLGLLRLLGATNRGREVLEEGAGLLAGNLFRMLRKDQLMIIVNDLLFFVGLVTLMLTWAWRVHAIGELSAGGLVTAVLLAVQLHEPIDSLGRTFYVGRGGRPLLERLQQLDLGSGVAPVSAPASLDPASVGLRNVTIRRGDTLVAAQLDLHVPAGTVLGVVGPTGCGKTSLAMALQGLLPVDGDVLLDEVPVPREELLVAVTTLPQDPYLFAGSVADNLRLAREDATDLELSEALQQVSLLDELPEGPATRIGEAGHGLSGGQARRLGLARALLSDPRVLILDEPTADLDARNSALVGQVVRALRDRTTVIQIAHRLATVRDADQVLVLGHEPRLASVAELLAEDGYFATATRLEER